MGKVEAGTIELMVEDASTATASTADGGGSVAAAAPARAALRLRVRARTAEWISRFFEADDEFMTDVSGDLMSIRHVRRLQTPRLALHEH